MSGPVKIGYVGSRCGPVLPGHFFCITESQKLILLKHTHGVSQTFSIIRKVADFFLSGFSFHVGECVKSFGYCWLKMGR